MTRTEPDGVARIWRETLGLAEAAPDDHFFDLGGTSRQVMSLLQRVRTELGRDVPFTEFITRPTLADLTSLAGASRRRLERPRPPTRARSASC